MNKLKDKIYSLRHEGLTGRIALYFIGVSLALSILYGIGAYSVIFYLLRQYEDVSTKNHVEIAAQKTEIALKTLASTVESLSVNTIFVNGLVDAFGRESYLIPYLKSSRLPVDVPHRFSLCDFKGDIIASSESSGGSYAGEAGLINELVNSARPAARMIDNGKIILICYPVIYPAVGTSEGFLALEIPVSDLMLKLDISKDASENGFQLLSGTKRIWRSGHSEGTEHSRQLTFSNPLAQLRLLIQVWIPKNPALIWFTIIFIFTVLFSLCISIIIAYRISAKLTSRLVALDSAAAIMAASGTPQGEIETIGTDEVARVGASFNAMIRRLKESYQLLEARVEERTLQLQNANDELERENAFSRDIMEQLKTSNDRYDELVRRIPVGVYILKVCVDGSMNFEYASPRFCEILGIALNDVLQDADLAFRVAHPEEMNDLIRAHRESIVNHLPFQWEGRFEVRGVTLWLKIASVPSLLTNGDTLWNGVITDISKRKMAEENLKQLSLELEHLVNTRTAELEKTNEELEFFCYAISHELRAPVARLRGFSEAISDNITSAEESRFFAERIEAASRQLQTVIDAILLLSRLSKIEMKLLQINLSSMANDVAAELQSAGTGTGAEINIQEGLECIGDPDMMRVCLVNLFGNALKFSSSVDNPGVEFGMTVQDGENVFHITDNGAGFDMEFVNKLFVPFQRLHNQNEFPGNGIGLATVQRIIERHGGRIWAEASEGEGATFSFTLAAMRT